MSNKREYKLNSVDATIQLPLPCLQSKTKCQLEIKNFKENLEAMKQQTVCILLALVLVSAAYTDALVFVYVSA